MRGSTELEFCETVSSGFLKTVCAFANSGTGEIRFGIADDGTVKGVADPTDACLAIESRINDSIIPVPVCSLSTDEETSVITLKVCEGLSKPCLYRADAYLRSGYATVPADRPELTRLILEGQKASFEALEASSQELTFSTLRTRLADCRNTPTPFPPHSFQDMLRSLELCSSSGKLNKAAEIFADTNELPGTEIVRYGENGSVIHDRQILEHMSVLEQYDQSLQIFRQHYSCERTKGSFRETMQMIPESAFCEALTNALMHRAWDVNAPVSIAMHPDSIVITSPGGLPEGMGKEDLIKGGLSVSRNRITGNIFFRLRLAERFGTGITRINESYGQSQIRPGFDAMENAVRITLPVIMP